MKIVCLGSGEFGLPTLEAIHNTHEVVLVITQPDRPAGRSRKMKPTAIATWATENNLPVLRTENVNDASVIEQVKQAEADAGVVIAFGQKLSGELVDALGEAAINLHASLLPKYRGAAPINWALIRGEHETGVSVISIDQKMDGGVVYAQQSTRINPDETAGDLHDRLADLGPKVVLDVLSQVENNSLAGQPQNEQAVTQAPKLKKDDGWISFDATAHKVRCKVHGLTPWPGARTAWVDAEHGKTHELIIRKVREHSDYTHDAPAGRLLDDYVVATIDGAIELLEVQAPGGRPMTIEDFSNGHPLNAGDRLASPAELEEEAAREKE